MHHVRVTLTARGREAAVHPMYDLLANGDPVDRATALQWNVGSETAATFLHYVEGDLAAFEARLSAIDAVRDYDLEPAGDRAFYAYVTSRPTEAFMAVVRPFLAGEVVAVPPIRYHEDGRLTLSVFGPSEEIQAGLETLPAPLEFTVEAVGGLAAVPAAADAGERDRQREAVETAVALGYYAVPREAGHEAVADEMGCAPSTAAEHLRKAEATVLRGAVGDRT